MLWVVMNKWHQEVRCEENDTCSSPGVQVMLGMIPDAPQTWPTSDCRSKARINPFYVLKLFPGRLFLGDGAVLIHMVRKIKVTLKALKELFFL